MEFGLKRNLKKEDDNNMYIYIGTFMVSSFLLWSVENKADTAVVRKIIVFLALLLPIMLAGMRAIGIGTDTKVYVNLLYDAAINSSNIIEYFNYEVFSVYQYLPVSDWEPGYCLLVYITTKLFSSYQAVLFVTQALINICVYKGLRYFKDSIPVWFGMLTFYFLFYNTSYNAMRQWIAMAILFWGFIFIVEKKKVKFIITLMVAMMFHTSAIIGGIVFLLYEYSIMNSKSQVRILFRGKELEQDVYKVLIVALVGIIVLLAIPVVANILSMFGPAFVRYVYVYLRGSIEFMPMQIIRRIPLFFVVICYWKKLRMKTETATFLVIMMVMDIVISQLGSITNQSGRIGGYFSAYYVLLYPYLLSVQKKNKFLVGMLLEGILFVTWYYDIVYSGRAETVPYRFYFQ